MKAESHAYIAVLQSWKNIFKLTEEFCPTVSAKCYEKYLNKCLCACSVTWESWYHYRIYMQLPFMGTL